MYTVNTRIPTLKRAWAILREMGLEALLAGGEFKTTVSDLCEQLLAEDKLVVFLQVITGDDADDFNIELDEALELAQRFFDAVTGKLRVSRLVMGMGPAEVAVTENAAPAEPETQG